MSLQMQEGSTVVLYLQTNKLICTVLWMLAEHMRYPGQRQGALFLTALAVIGVSACVISYLGLIPVGRNKEGQGPPASAELHHRRNWSLGKSDFNKARFSWKEIFSLLYWTVSKSVLCSGRRLCLAFMAIHYANSLGKTETKTSSSTAHEMCRNGRDCEKLFPNSFSLWSFNKDKNNCNNDSDSKNEA